MADTRTSIDKCSGDECICHEVTTPVQKPIRIFDKVQIQSVSLVQENIWGGPPPGLAPAMVQRIARIQREDEISIARLQGRYLHQ
jgi:hypothetical protein